MHMDIDFPETVTIAAADTNDPPVVSKLELLGVSNLAFDGITFDYTFEAGQPTYVKPFQITNSQNVTIQNCIFDGDVAEGVSEASDGYGYGYGLTVRSSENITVQNNEVFN